MSQHKQERFEEIIRDCAARFISEESNRTSLITVTRVETNDAGSMATIFFTVLPDDQEAAALDFLKRQRSAFREYIKEHARLMRIPFFDFQVDLGEKSRRKIDGLMNGL